MSTFQIQSLEVLARLKPFGITFEKSLNDLIKGIRSHSKESPESLSDFLDVAIQECKDELTTTDLEVKATAVLKLAYLEMYGFEMTWCNFHILEVMSSGKFQQKRIGYLAAMQSFKNEQDLLILATNQFKKDLNSHNHIEVGLALSGIATIVTPHLAKDIVDDVVMKLTHSKPYIRKKAVLALFKVFLQYPEALRLSLPRVIDKLDDPDTSVVSATITVVCEISKKNPNIFIGYLPKFFAILEDTQNNWLIIRILKLFQSLLKIEPRMKKKILPSILSLMAKTDATSLIYECISCIVNGGMLSPASAKDKEVAKQCILHLMKFFDTRDSNLKFVGLIALINILQKFPVFMHKVKGLSTIIMDCLADKDTIIKKKALEICQYLVTDDNITHLFKTLLLQLVPDDSAVQIPESIKLEITDKILEIAGSDSYSKIPNFKWYVTVLKDVVNMTLFPLPSDDDTPNTSVAISKRAQETIAKKLGGEFKNIATKVPSVRPFLMNNVVFDFATDPRALQYCPGLMRDLYWIMGEYIDELGATEESDDDDEEDGETNDISQDAGSLGKKIQLFNTLVNCYIDEQIRSETQFPVSKKLVHLQNSDVLIIMIPALVKTYNGLVSDYISTYGSYNQLPYDQYYQLAFFLLKLIKFFDHWEQDTDYEVQERILSWLEFLRLVMEALGGVDVFKLKKLEAEEIAHYKEIATKGKEVALEDLSEEDDDDDEDEDEDDAEDGYDEEDEDEDKSVEEPNLLDLLTDETEPKTPKEMPSLLTNVLPSFFKTYPLNPVAASSQKKIKAPETLDLDTPISYAPLYCFDESEDDFGVDESDEEEQEVVAEVEKEPDAAAQERLERMKDDPFYITPSGKKQSKHRQGLFNGHVEPEGRRSNSELASERSSSVSLEGMVSKKSKKPKKIKKEKVTILGEESVGEPEVEDGENEGVNQKERKKKTNRLVINSANLDNFDLSSPGPETDLDRKDFEYDIDLDKLRSELATKAEKKAAKEKKRAKRVDSKAESGAERQKKKESKKESKKKLKKDSEPDPIESKEPEPIIEDPEPKEPGVVNSDDKVVVVSLEDKNKQKKKKKKKAVIED